MLKIYKRTIKYELHNEGCVKELNVDTEYVIRDEKSVAPKTAEFGAYTEKAHEAYIFCSELKQKKKGKLSYFYGWPSEFYLREWDAPNAKLVMHVSYKESSCSMRRLMELPATDVIAYLKQEGLSLVTPS